MFRVRERGGSAVMGRGGSDLTAVFLSQQLGADECRLLKDVDGIYERDPAKVSTEDTDERPHRDAGVAYEEALRVSRVLVQPKAVQYLQSKAARASKRIVGDHGAALTLLALKHGAQFRYSAAVGGSAPMIETLESALEAGSVAGLRGVLSGTCNVVLDKMSEGAEPENAVAEAQACGFAEADIARDLSGEDSAD